MKQLLSTADVTPALHSLFDAGEPQAQRCFAVLAGRAVGKILSDNPHSPTWGAVWEAGDGTLYLGGAIDAGRLNDLVRMLQTSGDVLLGMARDDPRWALAPAAPDYMGYTIDFDDRTGAGLEAILQRPPAECTLRLVDEALLVRSSWHSGLIRQFGSAAGVLRNALGCYLLRGDEIVCEVFAGPHALGVIELSVETQVGYQRRGYANYTCAHVIQLCEERGWQVHWNCAHQNFASAALARKLGFQRERTYQLWAWNCTTQFRPCIA
jgi:hypothetical protein